MNTNLFKNKFKVISVYAREPNPLGGNEQRQSFTGHIWVGLDEKNTWGFQTVGVIPEDPKDYDAVAMFRVSESEHNNAIAALNRIKGKRYFIDGDVCIGLVCKVVIAAGLKLSLARTKLHELGLLPAAGMLSPVGIAFAPYLLKQSLPIAYLKDLRDNNK